MGRGKILDDLEEGNENADYSTEEGSDNETVDGSGQTEEEKKSAGGVVKKSGGFGGGMFSVFKGLVGSRTVTKEQLVPIIAKMRLALIEKNVAAEIAEKLCQSVSEKLEGKALGTFEGESIFGFFFGAQLFIFSIGMFWMGFFSYLKCFC